MYEVCERPVGVPASARAAVAPVGSVRAWSSRDVRSEPVPVGDGWIGLARCRGLPTGLFFSDEDEETSEAFRACAECSVRLSCLEYAVVNHIRDGIWGGVSERGRRRIQRTRRAAGWPLDSGADGRQPVLTRQTVERARS